MLFISLLLLFPFVYSDTPANCTYEDIKGIWTFSIGEISNEANKNCDSFQVKNKIKLTLIYPNIVFDELGNSGTWTMIYNQGFEITIRNRKYFAFSKFYGNGDSAISICNTTLPGWTHDVLLRQWACFSGEKLNSRYQPVKHSSYKSQLNSPDLYLDRKYLLDESMVDRINNAQNSWRAKAYPHFADLTLRQINLMSGSRGRLEVKRSRKPLLDTQTRRKLAQLPEQFDWRNHNGRNFVSSVRNQAQCGSCYAFASAAQLEARIAIRTNLTVMPTLSPQDIVECSPYAQGCDGGFPYLIAGKYAEDFGMADESCNPYKGADGVCSTRPGCKRYYATNYHYVGGYYGACSEEAMLMELVTNGPFAVGFEVYPDFKFYHSGVYVHTGIQEEFNPFELTNHAVLVVGYGKDQQTGLKYWIVKNSWGTGWGMDGYFWIRRGADECAIESLAVSTDPVL